MNISSESSRVFLLRWNPAISSFKLKDYESLTSQYPEGFGLDWSIFEWEKAHAGDRYLMLRVGDGPNVGIVWQGDFLSNPYEGGDWAGKGVKRHYVDMSCLNFARKKPHVSIAQLQQAMPDVDWNTGHSGIELTEAQYQTILDLWVG